MGFTDRTLRGLVLIVDDQKNWRDTLEELLQAEGYQIRTSDNLAEARRLLSTADFDVGVLDIRLLNEDRYDIQGLQLLSEIKEAGLRTRVLVMTGYASPETEARVKEIGAEVFVFKSPPGGLDIGEFRQVIGRLVQEAQDLRV
jgi:DNA-binding NtrC family response regulator